MAKPETLRCGECDRALVNRLVDKCLYCGAELDEKMILSEAEKKRLREEETQKLLAERDARIKKERERDSGTAGSGGLGDDWMLWDQF